ncbi:hypothetical protein [Massilibacteroides sp.]|uniref:hypothetical protein n=1 Tax=Massilibacteroides sp. TaxID=2034766 RepID=UPI0026193BD1|nr:hypothetical protein [Massilibacteroides sp.]MDD4514609.1 hypothetical protein [Massilibacteroides sp.]
MKRINLINCVLLSTLFVVFVGCSSDDDVIKEQELPVNIKSDLAKRNPSGTVLSVSNYDDRYEINFIDETENETTITYVNEVWKLTHTLFKDVNSLPSEVKKSFNDLPYKNTPLLDVSRTERADMKQSLYTLHFQYPWKDVDKLEHHVFINDDGLYLAMYSLKPNDQTWWPDLPSSHFKFIETKYSGAEIRGYINNAGIHEYFILHDNIIKYVFFGGIDADYPFDFWEKTEYELPIDTKIPENVMNELKEVDKDFSYTNLYYIESNGGDSYWFQDKNHPNELGYTIPVNIKD